MGGLETWTGGVRDCASVSVTRGEEKRTRIRVVCVVVQVYDSTKRSGGKDAHSFRVRGTKTRLHGDTGENNVWTGEDTCEVDDMIFFFYAFVGKSKEHTQRVKHANLLQTKEGRDVWRTWT